MTKWADYCISKLSFAEEIKTISSVVCHVDNGDTIGDGEERNRNWLVQKADNGSTFCCIERSLDGKWDKISHFNYENGNFKWNATLPQVLTRRKTFVSYFHKDDEAYKTRFEKRFKDLIVAKSVGKDEIDSDNSDEYIKQLIQNDYLHDTTLLAVLVGPKTKCRKHIDWEIAGALNYKIGDTYAGLLGILLPNHPDYGAKTYHASNLPKRLAENVDSGYALLVDWTDDRAEMQKHIENAFKRRSDPDKRKNLSIPQMTKNTCE